MITRESTRLVREPLPFRDGIGYAGLVAAYKRELDVLWHRLALENRRCLVVKVPLLLDDFSAVLNGFVGRGGTSRAGPLLAATAVGSDEELGPRWLDVSARKCLSDDRGGGGKGRRACAGRIEVSPGTRAQRLFVTKNCNITQI